MKLTPIGDKIIIGFIEEKPTTKSGLVLSPASIPNEPKKAVVLAIGDGNLGDKTVKMLVKTGDKVYVPAFAGMNFVFNGESLTFISQNDILAIIEE